MESSENPRDFLFSIKNLISCHFVEIETLVGVLMFIQIENTF